jgi:hypothetical protein
MIRLLWTASVEVRYFLRRYMPSNIVLRNCQDLWIGDSCGVSVTS